ncbi:hypothetical protein C3L50_10900 [Flavobacterium alvei]|uniref:Uncharacterized protein n=1 Tax=Flavobacterium alvei TaxID=2080416 RepID=A0A2S5A952_9FLAO|nr:hypothetical protein [Flavobacterium alvei]POY38643.1 hypothetical protein C3L50_10900 [Flavobacterium alvei]
MENTRLLKVLSLVAFLLLMAPFYDQCNGHGWTKNVDAPAVEAIDTTAVETSSVKNNIPIVVGKESIINSDTITEIIKEDIPIYKKAYEFVDDVTNENAF